MQKWEYCAVVGVARQRLQFNGFYPRFWEFTASGIKETDISTKYIQSTNDELAKKIAQLGQEGWELTGVGQFEYESHVLYFKRPAE